MGGNVNGIRYIYEYLKICGVISQLLVQRKKKRGQGRLKFLFVCLFVCFLTKGKLKKIKIKRKRKRKTLYRGRSFFNQNIFFI